MNKNELKEQVIEYVDRVFFFCIKRVKNRMDAEVLAQTIILEVLKSIFFIGKFYKNIILFLNFKYT